MSEYMFAAENAQIPAKVAQKRDQIARKIGGHRAGYLCSHLPEGWKAWAYIPNRGFPFDQNLAKEIMDAWAKAGVGLSQTNS